MPGQTIGKDLIYGFPGVIAESPNDIVRTYANVSGGNVNLGTSAMIAAGGAKPCDATATAALFAGVVVQQVQTMLSYLQQNGAGLYAPNTPMPVIKSGAAPVTCQYGTPTQGGAVYLRVAANSSLPNAAIGGMEATADGTNNILLPNCSWQTGMDANNTATMTINYPVN